MEPKATTTEPTEAELELEHSELLRQIEFVRDLTMGDVYSFGHDFANAEGERLAEKLEDALDAAILEFMESEPELTVGQTIMALHQMLSSELYDFAPEPCECTRHQPGCIHYKRNAAPEATPEQPEGL